MKIRSEKAAMLAVGTFYLLFSLLLGAVYAYVLFDKSIHGWHRLPLFAAMAAAGAVLALVWRALGRIPGWLERYGRRTVAIGCLALAGIQILLAARLEYQPTFDLEAIYGGAQEWVRTGNFASYATSTCAGDYFCYFPNNFGGLALLALAFRLTGPLGESMPFFVASVLCSGLVSAAVWFGCEVCRLLWGRRQAVFCLCLFLLMPPFYLAGAAFYTDFLSMLFPVLGLYCFLRMQRAAGRRSRVLWLAGCCAAVAVGTLIKGTVAITAVTLVIVLLCMRRLRRAAVTAACLLAVCMGVQGVFSAWMTSHLDPRKAELYATPTLHWVMMGLQGNGGYSAADYDLTRSFTDTAARDEALKEEIGRRVSALGVSGLADLWERKLAVDFGDGTLAVSDFLDDRPVTSRPLHQWVLYGGEHYKTYQTLCNGVYLVVALLMVAGAVLPGREKGEGMAPWLCVFGLALFLMMWESSARYVTNFVPLMLVCAAGSMPRVCAALRQVFRRL